MDASTKDTIEVTYWIFSTLILLCTVYFIYKAPLKAVQIANELDKQKGKENAKRNLLFTLFCYRGLPVDSNFINGLNTIDIIFQDSPDVVISWHTLRDSYNQKLADQTLWDRLTVDLLSKMAISLDYKFLSQLDIMSYYIPQGHIYQRDTAFEHKNAELLFHKLGAEVYQLMKNYYESLGAQKESEVKK